MASMPSGERSPAGVSFGQNLSPPTLEVHLATAHRQWHRSAARLSGPVAARSRHWRPRSLNRERAIAFGLLSRPMRSLIPGMTDVASIVPSTRDFLQAIATRRKRLVLVPLVDRADDARALAEAGVTVFAVVGPSDGMRAVSDAVGSSPLLSLAPVASADDGLV